jgi:hypothetical protein
MATASRAEILIAGDAAICAQWCSASADLAVSCQNGLIRATGIGMVSALWILDCHKRCIGLGTRRRPRQPTHAPLVLQHQPFPLPSGSSAEAFDRDPIRPLPSESGGQAEGGNARFFITCLHERDLDIAGRACNEPQLLSYFRRHPQWISTTSGNHSSAFLSLP